MVTVSSSFLVFFESKSFSLKGKLGKTPRGVPLSVSFYLFNRWRLCEVDARHVEWSDLDHVTWHLTIVPHHFP